MTILVVGDANADLSASVGHVPGAGDDAIVEALVWGSGGSAANTAAALAALGAPCQLLARVGEDPAAAVALRAAAASGVGLALIQRDPALPTGLCYAAVRPDGERAFFSYRGANAELRADRPAELLAGVGWLHVSGYALLAGQQRLAAEALLDAAALAGVPCSLDLCVPLARDRRAAALALLPRLAALFANELELALLAGLDGPPADPQGCLAAAQLLRAHGAATVVGKCGAQGCVLAAPDLAGALPGLAVQAVDTTGCGDVFVAGYLAAQRAGCDALACAAAANAAGALAATRVGAAESLPTRAELRELLLGQAGQTSGLLRFISGL